MYFLVDSVNALNDTFVDIINGNFNFISNPKRVRMLQVLAIFTLGSITGLVTFSHVLSYILDRYKSITTSAIIGFIVGSLGVVWPWKKTIYKLTENGSFIFDSTGSKVVLNYQRFIPDLTTNTFIAIGFVLFGIALVLGLEWYGNRTRYSK
ncbi:undecaprenyl phosphate translocase family protein [Algibacter miyuki]|uniref:undecaprenyl phosphate translocase family protein n=1 Tax=Algibacter miyuki TaxID=1306933 RepID=UPI003B00BE7F